MLYLLGLVTGLTLAAAAILARRQYVADVCAENDELRQEAAHLRRRMAELEQARRVQAARPVVAAVFRVPDVPDVLGKETISAHGQHGMDTQAYSLN